MQKKFRGWITHIRDCFCCSNVARLLCFLFFCGGLFGYRVPFFFLLVCFGLCCFVSVLSVSVPPVAVVVFSPLVSCLGTSRCRSFVLGLCFGFFCFGSGLLFLKVLLPAVSGPVSGRFSGFKKRGAGTLYRPPLSPAWWSVVVRISLA